jgi:hypothetical protein
MKELRPLDTRGPFAVRPHHFKMLFGGFILVGLVFGLAIIRLIYNVLANPYSYRSGNDQGIPSVHASQAVYLTVALCCLLSDLSGTCLIVAGQLKEKRRFSVIGLGLIVLAMVGVLSTRMIE